MLKPLEELSKKIAWNGISLEIPITWEIEGLDVNYMLIGEDESPKLELKWTNVPEKFTLEKYLKQFVAKSQKVLGITISELPVPDGFSHPVKSFKFFFFSWKSKSSSGKGTLVFCSQCKRLTLIRFFLTPQGEVQYLAAMILNSFKDHSMSDMIHWQLFGLKFLTPVSFKLCRYSFKPGYYVLELRYKKILLKILSWGPASFLLSEKELFDFAKERMPQIKGEAKNIKYICVDCLEWSYRRGRFKICDKLPFLNQYALYSVVRICHDRKNNRIFGITADSSYGFEYDLINRSMAFNKSKYDDK